jgi:3-hydroxyisobutyrate dehydrogenase-like beta-hydroxyacid dehydrogenase
MRERKVQIGNPGLDEKERTMADAKATVACIGLGRMGAGIAHCIRRAGFPLIVYNRSAEKTQPFVSEGAIAARTPREAAAAADFVLTSLMDNASVLGSVTGADGLLAAMRPGAVHIGTTTISPRLSGRLAQMHADQGSLYLASPVFGRPEAASAGKLIALIGGKSHVIDRARPVIDAYATRVIVLGEDAAMAASMKLTGNFFLAGLLEAMGQAFVFAEKHGVSVAFGEMLKGFLPNSQEYVDRIRTRDFDRAGFTLDAGLKDIRLILDAAAEVQVPLPCASLIRDHCLAAQARGLNQRDWSVFTEIARLDAGQDPV